MTFFTYLNKFRVLILLIILAVCFFLRKDVRSVNEIQPELLRQPEQYAVSDPSKISFRRKNFQYSLTPLYDYQISGLVTSKLDYSVFSIYEYSNVFPVDLCLIWGSNAANKVYQKVKFSQDCRFCLVSWGGNVDFNWKELSNNHLVINDNAILKRAKSLLAGDQITIKGQLVDVDAVGIGKGASSKITWKSSRDRDDTGKGACEVIYVEDIEILRRGNLIYRFLFTISFFGLIALFAWWVVGFFITIRKPKI